MPLISVVSPVYGCRNCLHELYNRILLHAGSISQDFEIIFINDGGPDNAWPVIEELSALDNRVKGIDLSRNFGQHYAIHAGLSHASGDWIVVMDCDLQDQPEEIVNLYHKAMTGYDIVLAQRVERQDNFFKRKFSQLFYATLSYLTETEQDSSVANFGIYRKSVIDAILSMHDTIKYFPAMVKWVGFRRVSIEVNHSKRLEGESAYNFRRLFKLALDIIISFSDKPLRLTVKAGMFISTLSVAAALVQMIRYINGDIKVAGFASLIISIWFLSGIIILISGITGLYIGKTFDKVKDRPVFIVRSTAGFSKDKAHD